MLVVYIVAALIDWDLWQPQGCVLSDYEIKLKQRILGYMYSCKCVTVGGARFSFDKNEHQLWFVAMKEPTNDDVWVGKLTSIYKHMQPVGQDVHMLIVDVEWHAGVEKQERATLFDPMLKLCVEKRRHNMPSGNLWTATKIAPVNGV
jgi:hypothetical protein